MKLNEYRWSEEEDAILKEWLGRNPNQPIGLRQCQGLIRMLNQRSTNGIELRLRMLRKKMKKV